MMPPKSANLHLKVSAISAVLLVLIAPETAGATVVTCSAGGTGTVVQCNDEAYFSDIRILLAWLVGVILFGLVLPVLSRTFRA
jgi:hypothetical protein